MYKRGDFVWYWESQDGSALATSGIVTFCKEVNQQTLNVHGIWLPNPDWLHTLADKIDVDLILENAEHLSRARILPRQCFFQVSRLKLQLRIDAKESKYGQRVIRQGAGNCFYEQSVRGLLGALGIEGYR